jgi:predicted metalloprotease
MIVLATMVAAFALASGLLACDSGEDSDQDLASALDEQGVYTAEAPAEEGDPDATAEPDESALAELPKLSRAEVNAAQPTIRGSAQQTVAQWMETVVNDVALFWQQEFNSVNREFPTVSYSIYAQAVDTACDKGVALPGDGPFYCPNDRTMYLSVPYFQDFYGRIGDAALAIPIAHEAGHHVQNIAKILTDPKRRSIEIELGADCFAGVWAQSIFRRNLFEPGDIEEAQRSRIAVADPVGLSPKDPQAHGTAKQRIEAFLRGYASGDPEVCL